MHQITIGIAAAILAGLALTATGAAAQEENDQPRNRFEHDILVETFGYDQNTPSTVDFGDIFQGCPARDCIPSIDDPEYVSAEKAARFMREDELVMAIDHNGDKRAWPIRILDFHEIVNDKIGGEFVAVTWCPLCGSGLAFRREVGGEVVEFGVSGLLHDSDLVMYDRKTNSLWQQITGEAIMGPAMGETLQEVPATITEWATWKSAHPKTVVLSPPDSGRDYAHSRHYAAYEKSDRLMFPAARRDLSIHPKTVVHGFSIDGQHIAVTERALEENERIETRIGDQTLVITRNSDGSVTAVDGAGREHTAVRSFWFAWFNFHPDTRRI